MARNKGMAGPGSKKMGGPGLKPPKPSTAAAGGTAGPPAGFGGSPPGMGGFKKGGKVKK